MTVNILEERAGIIILPPVTHRTLARRRGLSRGLAIFCRMRLSLGEAFAAHLDVVSVRRGRSVLRSVRHRSDQRPGLFVRTGLPEANRIP